MFTLNCKGKLLRTETALVMGIINATPDSFYTDSRRVEETALLELAEKMIRDGADILDIGGQSTRPGSEPVNAETELARVLPAIKAIHSRFPDVVLSVDTFYSIVANEAVAAGASIVNDVSAGSIDELLIPIVASLNVPYVLMHTPGTMHGTPKYTDVTVEVLDFLRKQLHRCREAGIVDVIIDPGFGFGKTIQDNFDLLHNLSAFTMLAAPLLAGISRKSTIYKTLGITADEALNGTTVLNTIALMNGASILRVHDVKEAREAVTLVARVNGK